MMLEIKKEFYRIVFLFIIFVILLSTGIAQTGEVSMEYSISGGNIDVSLYLRRTAGDWKLGNASFYFSYNSIGMSTPTEYAEGIWDINTNSNYGEQYITNPLAGLVSIEVVLNQPNQGTTVPTTIEHIGTIRFTITNPSENHNLQWDSDNSIVYLDNNSTPVTISFVNPSNGPLPVVISSFTYSIKKNNVILSWTTSEEINNKGFYIQRKKSNTENWTEVGFVEGYGNSSQPRNYSFEERNLSSGTYEYRLKQVDYNNSFEYFNLNSDVIIGIPETFSLSQNYPNPSNPSSNIDFQLPFDTKVTLKVYDLAGREVVQLINGDLKEGYHSIRFDGSGLASGIYMYKITAGSFTAVKKLVLIK